MFGDREEEEKVKDDAAIGANERTELENLVPK